MSTIISKQLSYVRQLDRHMTDSMQNSIDVDQWYVNGWSPLVESHVYKNLLQISPRANSQFHIRRVWCYAKSSCALRMSTVRRCAADHDLFASIAMMKKCFWTTQIPFKKVIISKSCFHNAAFRPRPSKSLLKSSRGGGGGGGGECNFLVGLTWIECHNLIDWYILSKEISVADTEYRVKYLTMYRWQSVHPCYNNWESVKSAAGHPLKGNIWYRSVTVGPDNSLVWPRIKINWVVGANNFSYRIHNVMLFSSSPLMLHWSDIDCITIHIYRSRRLMYLNYINSIWLLVI